MYKLMNVEDLIEYEKNPRIISKDAVNKVANSIKEFGFKQPIVVDKNNIIIVGHTRKKAALQLGLKKVPVIIADDLDEAKIRAYRLADNKTAEISQWDFSGLEKELESLRIDFDMSKFGFDKLKEKIINEDDFDSSKVIPRCKKGDIWQLGKHKLMCGDMVFINRLINNEIIDLVFTDPPYQLETKGGCKGITGQALKKQGKDIEFIAEFNPSDFLGVLPSLFMKNKLNAYIFCNKNLLLDYLTWTRDNKYSYNVLIWKKPNAIPIGDSHRPDIEYLLLLRKNAIWNNAVTGVNYSRCLEYDRETGLHPTMKPVKLIANELLISSNENGIVVDCYGGSGSTLIACEQTNRRCFISEIDEKYCDVIIERYEQFTEQKGELIGKT